MQVIQALLILAFAAPAVGLMATLALGQRRSKGTGIASTAVSLVLSILILSSFLSSGKAATEGITYIPQLNIGFSLYAYPISVVLLLMSSIVFFAAAAGGNVKGIKYKGSVSLLLLFQVAATGLFLSGNLLMYFIFWDIGVIAAYFMISALGTGGRRRSGMKFLIYSFAASVLLLLGIIMLYYYSPAVSGLHSFSIPYLIANASSIPDGIQTAIFALLFVAFMIKMPVFPLHSWMADAYADAPTEGSMLVSGVLSKFGAYGMLLLFLMLPIAKNYSQYVFALAAVSTFYAVFVAMRQTDLKKVLAYTSMAEMGIILAGIASLDQIGISGAIFGMLAHGVTIALAFLVAGSVEMMFGERNLALLKGIGRSAQVPSYMFIIAILGITGMPLTAGFIADLLIFIGAFGAFGLYGLIPLAAIILMGSYLYFFVEKSFFSHGPSSPHEFSIGALQKFSYALLAGSVFIIGSLPFLILNAINLLKVL
jgi:NADH-quinone oxidoreductase subunit M